MAIYTLSEDGLENLQNGHLEKIDSSIAKYKHTFDQEFKVTKECLKSLFFYQNNEYDYLLNAKNHLAILTHPKKTHSCKEKIDMLNHNNVGRERTLKDTIKTVCFYNKKNNKYHLAVVSGEIGKINSKESFKKLGKEVNPKKHLRPIDSDNHRVFEIGEKGCIGPFPPISKLDQIEAIYFDETLIENSRIGDLSISLYPVLLDKTNPSKRLDNQRVSIEMEYKEVYKILKEIVPKKLFLTKIIE